MADWQRLGEHVIARRLEIGYHTRNQLAEASGISARILGDIETGRRGRFDPKTLAALETTLGWTTGTANRVAEGAEPTLRRDPRSFTSDAGDGGQDEALIRVMRRDDLTNDQKRRIVEILIAERVAAERRRVDHAEELIRLVRDTE